MQHKNPQWTAARLLERKYPGVLTALVGVHGMKKEFAVHSA